MRQRMLFGDGWRQSSPPAEAGGATLFGARLSTSFVPMAPRPGCVARDDLDDSTARARLDPVESRRLLGCRVCRPNPPRLTGLRGSRPARHVGFPSEYASDRFLVEPNDIGPGRRMRRCGSESRGGVL